MSSSKFSDEFKQDAVAQITASMPRGPKRAVISSPTSRASTIHAACIPG